MKNRMNLKERIISMMVLFFVPICLSQVLPSVFYMLGTDVLTATIYGAMLVILFSILFVYQYGNKSVSYTYTPKIGWFILSVCIMLIFIMINQAFEMWIANHITDTGMSLRMDSIADMNLEKNMAIYLLYAIIIAPVSEELLFRIALYPYLKKIFSWMTAMVATSVMFGLMHMTLSHIITGTLLSMAMVLLMEKTKCMWITIVCHISYNFMLLFVKGDEMMSMANSTIGTVFLFLGVIFILAVYMVKLDEQVKQ